MKPGAEETFVIGIFYLNLPFPPDPSQSRMLNKDSLLQSNFHKEGVKVNEWRLTPNVFILFSTYLIIDKLPN